MSLAACSTGQLPYSARQGSSLTSHGEGATPAAACASVVGTGRVLTFSDGVCVTGTEAAPTTYHIVLQCESEEVPGLTAMRVDDYMSMFWSFVLAGVLVWGAKALLGLFTGDYEKS